MGLFPATRFRLVRGNIATATGPVERSSYASRSIGAPCECPGSRWMRLALAGWIVSEIGRDAALTLLAR